MYVYTKSGSSKYMFQESCSSKKKMGNKTITFKDDKPIDTIFFMGVSLQSIENFSKLIFVVAFLFFFVRIGTQKLKA